MKRIVMLVHSHIRKNKISSGIFVILVLITTFLIHSAFMIDNSFKMIFDSVCQSTNSADFAEGVPETYYEKNRERINEFLSTDPDISHYEIEKSIILMRTKLSSPEGEELLGSWRFRNADRKEGLSTLRIVEKTDSDLESPIYVPLVCKTFFGYELNDELTLNYKGQILTYHIAAFTEDILFGSRASIVFDLPNQEFQKLNNQTGEQEKAVVILIKSDNPRLPFKTSKVLGDAPFAISESKNQAVYSRVLGLKIYSYIMLVFSIINIIITVITIRFKMKNIINNEVRNIGTLKAIGYRNSEINLSYTLQFVFLSMVGVFAGIGVSAVFSNTVMSQITAEAGLKWQNVAGMTNDIKLICLLVLFIGFISWHSIRKAKNISPVVALRDGVENFNFRKNYFPLNNTVFPLNLAMAGKMFMNNRKQNSMMIIIVAACILASAFSITLFTNTVLKREGLLQISGVEDFSAILLLHDRKELDKMAKKIELVQGVSTSMKAIGPGGDMLLCDDHVNSRLTVYSDYGNLKRNNLIDGRYPIHDNEVAVSGAISKMLSKTTGDYVTVENVYQKGENRKEYLITGLTQGSYSGGLDIFMSMKGLKQINADAQWQSIYIYLDEEANIDNFIQETRQSYGTQISYIEDFQRLFDKQFHSNVANIGIMVFSILIITIAIVLLIVVLLTKSVFLDYRHRFGIMKAIGFTPGQIMKQVAASCVPVVAIGGFWGYLLSLILVDNIILVMFQGMGVYKINFVIPTVYISGFVLGICVLSYAVSALSVCRMKENSAVELIRGKE